MLETEIERSIVDLLITHDIIAGLDAEDYPRRLDFQPLLGDGSSRRFIRLFCDSSPCGIAVLPGSDTERDFKEFRSSLAIGRHLHRKGVPVPAVLGADSKFRLLLFEDLGDQRLHGVLKTAGKDERTRLYQTVVETLVRMQVDGAVDFDQNWCCDTEVYDLEVMTKRESGYFYRAFWKDTLYQEEVDGLEEEFKTCALRAMEFSESLFLHRDFQSRNLMIKDGQIRVIDFQAGRFGPPGYDIASLLIDPYAGLPTSFQEALLDFYLARMDKLIGIDTGKIRRSYPYLAVQRNLQIIGAFAFLSGKKRKAFFNQFLLPSLVMLENRLREPLFDDFVLMRKTVAESIRLFRNRFGTGQPSPQFQGNSSPDTKVKHFHE